MGWIEVALTETETIRFYSIADEIGILHDHIFAFIKGVSPGVIGLLVVTVIGTIIIALLLSVWAALNRLSEIQSPY